MSEIMCHIAMPEDAREEETHGQKSKLAVCLELNDTQLDSKHAAMPLSHAMTMSIVAPARTSPPSQ